jgi:hypothetical protein
MVSKRADYEVRIYRLITSVCTDVTDTTLIDQSEVMTISASVGVDGEVHEATVRVDNDPPKDILSGDSLTISLGWEGSALVKVFTGQIYDVQQSWQDGDCTLTLRAREFSFLFLTDKITSAYVVATDIQTIVLDLVTLYDKGSAPDNCELMISTTNVEASTKTRVVDFVGESILDCLNKMCDISQRDWYVDVDKDLNFFTRLSRSSGKTITDVDMANYRYIVPYDLLCNKVDLYGKVNKLLPWDEDGWTETLDGWIEAYSSPLSLDPGNPAAGTNSIRVDSGGVIWLYLNVFSLEGAEIDLTSKGAYQNLKFAMWIDDGSSPAPVVILELWCDNDPLDKFEFNLSNQFYPSGQWQKFDIPIGPSHEKPGEWIKVGSADWSKITQIAWSKPGGPPATTLKIDWLHFDNGKWYGTYEDPISIGAYGLKYKEHFDDTVYSDTSAARRAKEFVLKFRDPIDMVDDVVLEFEGQEDLLPGETITIDIPEIASPIVLRIDRLTHKITEDLDYEVDAILSLDPPTFPGKVQDVSERVRRLEEQYERSPAAESTEIDGEGEIRCEPCESLADWTFENPYFNPTLNADRMEGATSVQFDNLGNSGDLYCAFPDAINDGYFLTPGKKTWSFWFKSVARNTSQRFLMEVVTPVSYYSYFNYMKFDYDYESGHYSMFIGVNGTGGSGLTIVAISDVVLDTWYHFKMVWIDKDTQEFYIDDVLIYTFIGYNVLLHHPEPEIYGDLPAVFRFNSSATESIGTVRVDYILYEDEGYT